jgi:hypothetical protein
MFYLQKIKKLYECIKNNNEIPQEEKEKAKELLDKLSCLLALY